MAWKKYPGYGRELTLAQWAELLDIPKDWLYHNLSKGVDVETANRSYHGGDAKDPGQGYVPGGDSSFPLDVFATGAARNPFFKLELLQRQGSKCPVCGKKLDFNKAAACPTAYDRGCTRVKSEKDLITVDGTDSPVPDCSGCLVDDEGAFECCISRYVLVHVECRVLLGR